MVSHGIIRLNNKGPDGIGLTRLELDPNDFQGDLPEQHWHVYFEDESTGLIVGVWTTTSMQEAFGPYPGDEFMVLLEGNVIIVDGNGQETVIKERESFCVRNAVPVSWKQEGFCRKFFLIHNRTDGIVPEITGGEVGVRILQREELSEKLEKLGSSFPFNFAGEQPVQADAPAFKNDTETLYAGMWESEPFESLMEPFPCSEFVQLLEGKIIITEPSGESHIFGSGDVFFVPAGTVCSWKATENVRKFYCMHISD